MLTEHGVQIAPRTFYAWVGRAPSKRALWDATITEILAGYYEPDEHGRRKPESLYGSLKMWAHLQREGIPVAKSTVERLMRRNGWQGVRRQKRVRTKIPDPSAVRPPDLVDRQFGVPAPNLLLVADLTYVKLSRHRRTQRRSPPLRGTLPRGGRQPLPSRFRDWDAHRGPQQAVSQDKYEGCLCECKKVKGHTGCQDSDEYRSQHVCLIPLTRRACTP